MNSIEQEKLPVMISVRGEQYFDDVDPNATELMTEGTLEQTEDGFLLSYQETELTGMEGTLTTFEIGPGRVILRRSGSVWHIPGGQRCRFPADIRAEGDWSNAAFFLCMGALSPAGISVRGLDLASPQGDRAVLDILTAMGAEVSVSEEAVTVRRGALRGVAIDAGPIPDLIPVLCVTAAGAAGDTQIFNAGRLRLKESDRLRTTAVLLTALGGHVEEQPSGLLVHGTGHLTGGTADACGDHRIAMSAATAACLCTEPVTVSGSGCVAKSYPDFWNDFSALKGGAL